MDAKLGHNVLHVGAHGIDGYIQALRHLAPPGSVGQAVQHLALSPGEHGGRQLAIAAAVLLVNQRGQHSSLRIHAAAPAWSAAAIRSGSEVWLSMTTRVSGQEFTSHKGFAISGPRSASSRIMSAHPPRTGPELAFATATTFMSSSASRRISNASANVSSRSTIATVIIITVEFPDQPAGSRWWHGRRPQVGYARPA